MDSITKKQNLRKQVLYYHYELSNGNTMKPILRTEIAKKVGFGEDYNNDELFSAIKYLNDKNLLKTQTNMEDSITDSGVDEVESNFPTLPGIIEKSSDTSPIIEQITKLLVEIDSAISKCESGLLENIPLHDLHNKIEVEITDIAKNLEETWQLKVKKLKREWINSPKPGFCRKLDEATLTLGPWKELMLEILETMTGQRPKISEAYLGKGTSYTARKMLRDILKRAKKEIIIVDNYLHAEIMTVVESNIIDNPTIKIKFLTSDIPSNRNLKGFKSDYVLFKQQYSSIDIETKTNNDCHGRFIVIDGDDVYHSGHSFHDLGKKGDHLNKIDDEVSRKNMLNDFQKWWNGGVALLLTYIVISSIMVW